MSCFPFGSERQRKPGFHDIKKDLPDFETVADTAKESLIRQKALIKGGHHDLAWELSGCTKTRYCKSPACPRCVRIHRQGFYHAATKLAKQHKGKSMRIVTLIYYSESFTNKELGSFCPRRIKDRLRKQLERCNFTDPVIGGLELDYHEDTGLWLPHFHLLVIDGIAALAELRKKYFKKEKCQSSNKKAASYTSRPMLVQRLKNPPEQISYLCKQRWQLIRPYIDSNTPKGRTRKLRLKRHEFIRSLIVLDGYTFSDLMFLYGVRVNHNVFRATIFCL